MNARIESTLTLEEVAEHFERWRRNKKRGDRIPQPLWDEAIGLVETHGVSRVTRTLRLSATDLNKRRGIVGTRQRRQAPVAEEAFVEIKHESAPKTPFLQPSPTAGLRIGTCKLSNIKCPEGIFPQPEMEKRDFQVFGEGRMKDRRGYVVISGRNPSIKRSPRPVSPDSSQCASC